MAIPPLCLACDEPLEWISPDSGCVVCSCGLQYAPDLLALRDPVRWEDIRKRRAFTRDGSSLTIEREEFSGAFSVPRHVAPPKVALPDADNIYDEINRCLQHWQTHHKNLTSFDIDALRNDLVDSIGKLVAPALVELEECRAVQEQEHSK